MKIILNGQEKEITPPATLKSAIEQFCPETRPIIAEVNGQIIKNIQWNDQNLKNGDRIELVNVVGGG